MVVLRIDRMVISIVRLVTGLNRIVMRVWIMGYKLSFHTYIYMIKTQFSKVQKSLRIRMVSPTWNALRSCLKLVQIMSVTAEIF